MIGGSVGGLFAAHLLRQSGWDVAVFERAAGDLGDRGTGIGTRDELFALMRRIGLSVDASIGVDVAGRVGLGRDGSVMLELPVRAVTSAWSRIWRPLRQALPDDCHSSGRALVRVEQQEGGVAAIFDDRSRVEADLLVAADGLHSTARAQCIAGLAPRYAGYVAWRGAVEPQQLSPPARELAQHRMVFGLGDGELMLSIPMPSPQGNGRACHFVWFRLATDNQLAELCTDAAGRRHGTSIPPPLIRPELIVAMRRDANERLAPQLAELIHATPQIILQPIFDLESPRIAFERVALIGDAAFVARPHVASGVLKAAIDAETLTDALKTTGDVVAGLKRYEEVRQPYGASLVARGRHIGAAVVARNADAAARAETLLREYGSAGVVRNQAIAARVPV